MKAQKLEKFLNQKINGGGVVFTPESEEEKELLLNIYRSEGLVLLGRNNKSQIIFRLGDESVESFIR